MDKESFTRAMLESLFQDRSVSVGNSPWAVRCRIHGKVLLTRKQYNDQMNEPDTTWRCPACGVVASWDDDHYENYVGLA